MRKIALSAIAMSLLAGTVAAFAWIVRLENAGETYGLVAMATRKCGGYVDENAARELLAYRAGFPSRFDRSAHAGKLRGDKSYRVYGASDFCDLSHCAV